ncbi:hypothetical protein PPERSA_02304 [Pseudocohnilembus persalinus]|uniref:Uncharacterized protein n=1 Tax=Pseudocohnilembus persalinus TaxID=266149 RepID=A0A0V0QTW3_PSEPJ|nr:hypothetical protein PPERSA_02304 [Pseudocohnilembus persalinus]|eukprot:KRX05772.1 hypothetical protein PPERSA_02304 [Pseudocohnilembus persalinus]
MSSEQGISKTENNFLKSNQNNNQKIYYQQQFSQAIQQQNQQQNQPIATPKSINAVYSPRSGSPSYQQLKNSIQQSKPEIKFQITSSNTNIQSQEKLGGSPSSIINKNNQDYQNNNLNQNFSNFSNKVKTQVQGNSSNDIQGNSISQCNNVQNAKNFIQNGSHSPRSQFSNKLNINNVSIHSHSTLNSPNIPPSPKQHLGNQISNDYLLGDSQISTHYNNGTRERSISPYLSNINQVKRGKTPLEIDNYKLRNENELQKQQVSILNYEINKKDQLEEQVKKLQEILKYEDKTKNDLDKQIFEKTKEIMQYESQKQQFLETIDQISNQLKDGDMNLQQTVQNYNKNKDYIKILLKQVDDLKQTTRENEARINLLTNQLDISFNNQKENEKRHLQQIKLQQNEINALEEKLQNLQIEKEKEHQEFVTINYNLSQAKSNQNIEKTKLQMDYDNLKTKFSILEQNYNQLKGLEEENEKLKDEILQTNYKLLKPNGYSEQVKNLQNDISKIKVINDSLMEQNQQLRKEIVVYKNEHKDCFTKEEYEIVALENSQLQHELRQIQAKQNSSYQFQKSNHDMLLK